MKRPLGKSKRLRYPHREMATSYDQDLVAPSSGGPSPLTNAITAATASTGPAKPRIWRRCPLESLPPEIRISILSQMHINDLGALVHASPVYHQTYRCYRFSILYSSLAETLGDVMPDAVAVSWAGGTDEPLHLQATYKTYRSKGVGILQDKSFSLKQAREIAAFYRRTISPLIAGYSHWAQELHPDGTQSETLSRSETIRITRALYRFQLYCLLFGRGSAFRASLVTEIPPERMYRGWEILRFLEENYHPWEIEEIVCIWSFAGHTYSQAIKEIHSDFRRRRTITNAEEAIASNGAGPAPPVDMDELVERYGILKGDLFANAALKGIIDRGLELLHTVLVQRSRTRHGDLLTPICANLPRPVANTIPQDPFWEDTPIIERWCSSRSPRDSMQRRRVPLPFAGDGDATGPPLAWTILWKGTYSNVCGSFLPEHMRRWGHVMWDAERVQKVAMDSGDADITMLQRLSRQHHDFRDVIDDLAF